MVYSTAPNSIRRCAWWRSSIGQLNRCRMSVRWAPRAEASCRRTPWPDRARPAPISRRYLPRLRGATPMKEASIGTFAQVAALVLTLGAAVCLARGTLGLLATTKWGFNPDVVKSLAGQASDTQVGTLLLLLAFGLQLGTALRPARWVDFDVRRSAVVAGVVFSV